MSISVIPLGMEKMSIVWSVDPLRAGLDQNSIYQATPYVLTSIEPMVMLPAWSISPCLFPKGPGAIYKRTQTAAEGKCLDISRTTGSCANDLAYLSKLMWPLTLETLSSSHTDFSHKLAVLCGVAPRCLVPSPLSSCPGISFLKHYLTGVLCTYAYTYICLAVSDLIELSKNTQLSFLCFFIFN